MASYLERDTSDLNPTNNLKCAPPPLPLPVSIFQNLHNPDLLPTLFLPAIAKRHFRILPRLWHQRQEYRRIDQIRKRLAQRRFPLRRRKYRSVFFRAPGVGGGVGGKADGGVGEEGEDVVAVGHVGEAAEGGC